MTIPPGKTSCFQSSKVIITRSLFNRLNNDKRQKVTIMSCILMKRTLCPLPATQKILTCVFYLSLSSPRVCVCVLDHQYKTGCR